MRQTNIFVLIIRIFIICMDADAVLDPNFLARNFNFDYFWFYNSYLWTFDFYGPVRNAFDAGKSITRASGRGLGPEN